MFEYYGVKDIFVSIWKYKKIVLCMIMIFILGICGKNYLDVYNSVEQISYTATGQYFFEPVLDEENESGKILQYSGGQIAIIYKSLIESTYSKELISYFLNERGESISADDLANFISCSTTGEGFVLNITVNAPTKSLVTNIFDSFEEYFDVYQNKLYNKDKESYSIVGVSDIQEIHNVQEFDLLKSVLSGGVIGAFLSIFVIVIVGLFNPTVNRKSDFEMLEVPVLGEFQTREISENEKRKSKN